MEILIPVAIAYVAGIVSCAIWLKVTDKLKSKVEAKVEEARNSFK